MSLLSSFRLAVPLVLPHLLFRTMLPLLQEHPPPLLAPLPKSTQSLLRSTTVLPSLPSLLLELAHNSLDAHATRISITVDLDTWTLKCDDNGSGISRTGLEVLASGGRYSTSKLNDGRNEGADRALQGIETYGFRGEALASMADVATLEVRTRAKGEEGTNEMIVRDGEVLSLGDSSLQRAGQGTTVWVRDIFWKVRFLLPFLPLPR
jgi:DNA mismatch repair protein MLH3